MICVRQIDITHISFHMPCDVQVDSAAIYAIMPITDTLIEAFI